MCVVLASITVEVICQKSTNKTADFCSLLEVFLLRLYKENIVTRHLKRGRVDTEGC